MNEVAQVGDKLVSPDSSNQSKQGKENQDDQLKQICHACSRSLAKSKQLIHISGQMHRWHPECFKCSVCDANLDKDASCHVYNGQIICKSDYAELQRDQAIKCSRCRWPIVPSDWVHRAGQHVYHLACFSCDICLRQLSTGEQFTISIQNKGVARLLCRLHFNVDPSRPNSTDEVQLNSGNYLPADRSTNFEVDSFNSSQSCKHLQILGGSQKPHELQSLGASSAATRSNIQKSEQSHLFSRQENRESYQNHMVAGHSSASSASSSIGGNSQDLAGSANLSGSKSKRVRTTFTEDQLAILQNQFQLDSNPDGQDLERIAHITGLSKRVTQVWFQNSRARQKKHLIKRKPSAGQVPAPQQASLGSHLAQGAPSPIIGQSTVQQSATSGAASSGTAPAQYGRQTIAQQPMHGLQRQQLNSSTSRWSTNMSESSELSFDDNLTTIKQMARDEGSNSAAELGESSPDSGD